jgi:lysophospholipase L1-like esterase
VGDSYAVGLTPPLGALIRGVGGQLTGAGVIGTRIQQWAGAKFAQALASVPAPGPNLVLVSLGTNDMLLPFPSSEQADLDALVAQLRATSATLVWIGPPTEPFPDRGIRAMLARISVPLFRSDVLNLARGPDKIHPTAAGYAGWAGALVQWIG